MIEFLMGCFIGALVCSAVGQYASGKASRAAELLDTERRRMEVLERRAADLGGIRIPPDHLELAMDARTGFMVGGSLIGFDDLHGDGADYDELDTRR